MSEEIEVGPSKQETRGRYQKFEGEDLYWCHRGNTHHTHHIFGEIAELYYRLGGASERIGFPLTDRLEAADSPQSTNHWC
jgi:uncharacterized protein with LGFP repeats